MEPLPAAARIASSVAAAFTLLERAVEETGPGNGGEPLVVSVEQGFARRWLVPRLLRLRDDTGEHDLDLRLENRLEGLVGDGIDAAIRYGDGVWPGLDVSKLFIGRFFPVCSPAFMEAYPLAQLTDLYNVPLLRHAHPLWSWPHWFHSLGLPPPSNRGMMFDDSSLMLDAAAEGAGVALARDILVGNDLRNGRLIRPLAAEVESAWSYFFVCRSDGARLARTLALRDWLVSEASCSGSQRSLEPG